MRFTVLLLPFLFFSCAHHDFHDHLEKQQCEQGHVGSYTLAGTDYLLDTIIITGEGGITGIGMRLPLIAAASALHLKGPIGEVCARITGNLA
ncbi:MAG: hypothetical protein HQK50_18150 [Oligoflexia bacterium]|nr:hypothetical protein [Oligoflexia bacterium]MBF0367502.1 hypothetical protein [Oligoflexia bacterium]